MAKKLVRLNRSYSEWYGSLSETQKTAYQNSVVFDTVNQVIYQNNIPFGINGSEISSVLSFLKGTNLIQAGDGITVTPDTTGDFTKYTVSANVDGTTVVLDGGKIKSGLSLSYDETDGLSLTDFSGNPISSISRSELLGTAIISGSSYDSTTNTLTLTFSDESSVDISLTDLIDIDDILIDSRSTDYLAVEGSQFSIKTKPIASGEEGLVTASDAKDYIDSAITDSEISVSGDTYITATKTDGALEVSANVGSLTVSGTSITGSADKLATTGDIATSVSTVVTNVLNSLDSEVSDSSSNISISQENGELSSVSVTYSSYSSGTFSEGIVESSTVTSAFDDLFEWEEIN